MQQLLVEYSPFKYDANTIMESINRNGDNLIAETDSVMDFFRQALQ